MLKPASARWSVARQKAEQMAEDFTTPPIPALEIAEHSGVDVVFTDFNEFSDDVSGFCDFANKKIYVNSSDKTQRKNFTIAHELGHWVLHRELFKDDTNEYKVLPRFTKPDYDDPLEKEANFFAAELLVPTRLLKPVRWLPPAKLADLFFVSRTMMEHRVRNVRE